MDNIVCYDRYGYPLEFLTQWDQNIVMVVHGAAVSPIPVFRFSNDISRVSLVVKPVVQGDKLYVDIPNVLLTQDRPICVYVNYEHEDYAIKARHIFNIPVIPCRRPEDFEMTQNVNYVNWIEMAHIASEIIEELESEQMKISVGDTEPEDADILWFDTSE